MSLTERILHRDHTAYRDGVWTTPDVANWRHVTNPANGRTVGRIHAGGSGDAAAAIDSAARAFPSWSAKTALDRSRILRQWATLMAEHVDDLARIITAEQGKPLAESADEVHGSALFAEWYAEEGRRVYGEVIPASSEDKRILVLRQPIGVTALITPWNYPASMVARKAAPALAAGCTVVIKPASQTPLTAVAMVHLAQAAGFPPGVVNLVSGNASAIGAEFMRNPQVRKVSFTGSTEVGKLLVRQSADGLKKMSLELGGNAPLIVFADADLDAVVAAAIGNKFENCGQMCNGINVIYVQQQVAAEFTRRLTSKVQNLSVADGSQLGAHVGPVIDAASVARIEALVQDAVGRGAKVEVGGSRLAGGSYGSGSFFQPTVLSGVDGTMRMAHEEIFGPVAPILTFASEDEVLARVNASPYGLAAYVFTRDVRRVFTLSERLEVGMVAVNGTSLSVPQAPFGGIKQSGYGREGGHHGLEDFTTLKYVSLTL